METTPHQQQPLPVQPTPVVTQRQNSMTSSVLIGVLLLLIPIAAVAGYFYGKQSVTSPQIIEVTSPSPEPSPIVITPPAGESSEPEGVMCTMEAKVCPDGSYVGRSGPNCEFSPCPGETTKPTSDEAPSTSTSIQLEL